MMMMRSQSLRRPSKNKNEKRKRKTTGHGKSEDPEKGPGNEGPDKGPGGGPEPMAVEAAA